MYLEDLQLRAHSGRIHIQQAGQLGQRDGGVQLQQLLEGRQVALLMQESQEAPGLHHRNQSQLNLVLDLCNSDS